MKKDVLIKKGSKEPKQIREMKKTTSNIINSYVPSKGNSSWLVVVESPSKCKKIEEYLGSEYKCIATLGHLQYIEGLNAIEIKDKSFHIQYSVLPEKAGHIQQMRRLISAYSSNKVLIATDDDREGEAIAWHILTLFHLPPDTPRIKFHEITRPALIHAVQHPTVVNQALVQSQQARQVIDLLIGFKISPLLWKYVCQSKKDALSAGRCQTVALRLIYENDCLSEKASISTEKQWKTTGYFTQKNLPFSYSKNLNEPNLLQLYRDVQINPYFKFSLFEKKQRSVQPPKPLTTARLLQQYTSISPGQVMSLCQILYQEGYITYMRTDSENYSAVFLKQVQEFLNKSHLEFGTENPCCNSQNLSKELGPHEAIRVTCLDNVSYTGPINDQKTEDAATKRNSLNTLYQFIWRNTVQSCMPPALFDDVEIKATSIRTDTDNIIDGIFTHILEIPAKYGWMALGKTPEILTQQTTVQKTTHMFFQSIVSNTDGNKNPCLKLESNPIVERPSKHYSEASLITQLEKRGIGRPSTYAYLIETIVQRGYVKITDIEGTKTSCCNYSLEIDTNKQKQPKQVWTDIWIGKEHNRLVIQTVGIMTMEFLMTYFDPLFSYDYTRQMEGELDKVAEGKETKQVVCLNCQNAITEATAPLRTVERKNLPKIDGQYEFRIQKFGNALKKVLEDGTVEYYPVKNMKLDLERLNTLGGYSANDLLEFPNKTDYLGKYRGEDVKIQKGPFGWFIRYSQTKQVSEQSQDETTGGILGNGSISIPKGVDIHNIQLTDVISWIEQKENPTPVENNTLLETSNKERKPPTHSQKSTLLRTIDPSCSVRTGKYGPFLMVLPETTGVVDKKKGKKTVQFHSLKHFTGDYLTCPKPDLLQYVETLQQGV